MRPLIFLIIIFISLIPDSFGQNSEKAAIEKVIKTLFDGMRKGDSSMVRSVFHPGVRLQSVYVKDGKTQIQIGDLNKFLKSIGTPHNEIWDERISDVKIEHDSLLATAWMKYAFYLGDKFSHGGVDAFQLYKGEEGWKIIQLADTRYINK